MLQQGRGSHLVCQAYAVLTLPTGRPLPERLSLLWHGLRAVLETHHPSVAAIESVFSAVNAQSALKLGHARGVAMLAVAEAGCELREVAPAVVKQAAVGYGRATKEQVQRMVTSLLGLPEEPPEDAADALAVAMALAHQL